MKKIIAVIIAMTVGLASVGCSSASVGISGDRFADADEYKTSVSSPDGNTKVGLTLDVNGELRYNVVKSGVEVVESSALGMQFEGVDLAHDLSLVKATNKDIGYDYTNKSGRHSHVTGSGKELMLSLSNDGYFLDVIVRAYNDGYALRYNVRGDGNDASDALNVVSENTEFALPQMSRVYGMPYLPHNGMFGYTDNNHFSYEEDYNMYFSTGMGNKYMSMPMFYNVGRTDTYSYITESELIGSGFYGSYLQEQPLNRGFGILQTVRDPAGADGDTTVELPFTSPWRVGVCGSLKECVESELVEAVYGDVEYWKPDNYDELTTEEQKTFDYDWVTEGAGAWDWFEPAREGVTEAQTDYVMHEEYLDLAEQMGWKYIVLDAGWRLESMSLDNFKAFAPKAHAKGIKIIGWYQGLASLTRESLRARLTKWKELGLDGVKLDFFDGMADKVPFNQGEDKTTIEWYETVYQECAKLEMVVLLHGCNKPTGERRVYPNVIGREAIKGCEMKGSVKRSSVVDSLFSRALVGPTDYTPVVKPSYCEMDMTMGACMALSVLYESGVGIMADKPSVYLDEKIKDFFVGIPALRDETVFIDGAPESYFCAAIRKGDVWYAAGFSADNKSVTFDYSFLDDGEYTATVFTDTGVRNDNDVERNVKTVTKSSSETFGLISGGGFAVKLVKK